MVFPMKRKRIGEYRLVKVPGEDYRAFIPAPLPPEPPVELDRNLQLLLGLADRALGRLDGMTVNLPDSSFFIYLYIRKEAVLSAQIEGSQSTLSDLLLFELDTAPGVLVDDVTETSTYVQAMQFGLERIRSGFPFSARLMREIHSVLLARDRGSTKPPGEFRRSQNWIGGTRPGDALYVPPPANEVDNLIADLERFYHNSADKLPLLVRIALVHARFETIHPFLDGNGRLGRLLITLLLCNEKVLVEPLLYLSLYFKQQREHYYRCLQQLRENGDWETWLEFFLTGIHDTARRVVETARSSVDLFETDRSKLQNHAANKQSLLAIHRVFQKLPFLTSNRAVEQSGLSRPTVNNAFQVLEREGLIREITGRQRNRVYVYTSYFTLLNEGVEP